VRSWKRQSVSRALQTRPDRLQLSFEAFQHRRQNRIEITRIPKNRPRQAAPAAGLTRKMACDTRSLANTMAELFPNPKLPLNVIRLSYPSLHVDGNPVSVEQIREWYERGHLILLEGFRLDCNL